MAYDETLADRVRELLADQPAMTQMRMFGGLAWLVHGNMAVVVGNKGGLMVRVDPSEHERMLAEPDAAATVMRGRELRGWITVDAPTDVATWVRRGLAYARTLPPK